MNPFKIKVKSQKENKEVQKELFRRGYMWHSGENKTPIHLNNYFLFVDTYIENRIFMGTTLYWFNKEPVSEITTEELLEGKPLFENK